MYATYEHSYTKNSPERETTQEAIDRINQTASHPEQSDFEYHHLIQELRNKKHSNWHVVFFYNRPEVLLSMAANAKVGYKTGTLSLEKYQAWIDQILRSNAGIMAE